MFLKYLIYLVLLVSIHASAQVDIDCNFLFNKNIGRVPIPIKISEASTVPYNCSDLLTFHMYAAFTYTFVNTGYTIEARIPKPYISTDWITGGVIHGKRYGLFKVRFHFSHQRNESCSHEINGEKSPFEINFIYYNLAHKTYENATKHPAGLLQVSFPMKIVSTTVFQSVDFALYAYFKQLSTAGSKIQLSTWDCTDPWFRDIITYSDKYYVYSGTYHEPETNLNVDNTLNIVISTTTGIHEEQFTALKEFLGVNGKPLRPIRPANGKGSRVVYRSSNCCHLIT